MSKPWAIFNDKEEKKSHDADSVQRNVLRRQPKIGMLTCWKSGMKGYRIQSTVTVCPSSDSKAFAWWNTNAASGVPLQVVPTVQLCSSEVPLGWALASADWGATAERSAPPLPCWHAFFVWSLRLLSRLPVSDKATLLGGNDAVPVDVKQKASSCIACGWGTLHRAPSPRS